MGAIRRSSKSKLYKLLLDFVRPYSMTSLIRDVDNVYIYGGSFNINQQHHGEQEKLRNNICDYKLCKVWRG